MNATKKLERLLSDFEYEIEGYKEEVSASIEENPSRLIELSAIYVEKNAVANLAIKHLIEFYQSIKAAHLNNELEF